MDMSVDIFTMANTHHTCKQNKIHTDIAVFVVNSIGILGEVQVVYVDYVENFVDISAYLNILAVIATAPG